MKGLKILVLMLCSVIFTSPQALAENQFPGTKRNQFNKFYPPSIKNPKGATVVPGAFQVQQVKFEEISLNGVPHLSAAVIFNKEIDASTVRQNNNIRLLKKNENHFWVDASTRGNIVRIRPNFITWVSGAPLVTGVYIMHLRGTIKSRDGIFLDCDKDGKGEGGNLPAYESQMYNAVVRPLGIIGSEAGNILRK